jgi:uncharacterized protein YndB with AHSA1/START domain
MLRLDLERELPCPPARAWPLLAEPELMNRWSTAHVELISPGDGGHPAGVGAVRRVRVPGPPRAALVEIIEQSAAPRLIEYRVIAGAPIRHHRGEITVHARPGGSFVRWQVELDFFAPGLAWVAERTLGRELERSLDRLVAVAGDRAPVAARPPPPARDLADPWETVAALRDEVDAVIAAQRDLADRLLLRGDDRGHFARVYQYVTESLATAADNERFAHTGWLLRLVPVFHRFYEQNLRRRLGEAPGAVAPHWAHAFAATEGARARGKSPFEAALLAVFAGMRAHIEGDLPPALAEVYDHYRGRCDFARFRPDYLRMAPAFPEAGDRFLAGWPLVSWTRQARILSALTPRSMRGRLLDRRFYPLSRQRRLAFDRGAELARRV